MYQAGIVGELLRLRKSRSPGGDPRAGSQDEQVARLPFFVARNVLFLGLTSLVTDISSEMVSTVLPLYLVYSLELSPLAFGVVDGLYQGGAAIARIIAGAFADRWRRHKELAGIGYALSAVCKLGFFAAGASAPALTAVVVADRTGKGIRGAPRDALLSLSVPPSALATAFGVHRALDTAGATLGPLAAFGLLALTPGRFDVIFALSFCVATVGVALFALFVDAAPDPVPGPALEPAPPAPSEPHTAPLGDPDRPRANLWQWRSPQFWMLVGFSAILGATTLSDGIVYLVLQRRMVLEARYLPLLFVAGSLVYALLAIPFGRLADRVGRWPVFLGGHVASIGLYALLWAAPPGRAAMVGCIVLFGASYAATDGVLMAVASPMLPRAVRTTGLAAITTGSSTGRLLASISFGALWTRWGLEGALASFAGALLVAVTLIAFSWSLGARSARNTRTPSPKELA
ncbi:MFS transporter [Pendulispora albinea]|uniref:MFS transporter n=1 Tax=Pendulispora albinea TaxID=2741071 RepID=A0ABZ2LYI5_9BACT